VVAKNFEGDKVFTYYPARPLLSADGQHGLRSGQGTRRRRLLRRGRTPTLVSLLETPFLTRLADQSLDTVVEPSHFTSYPRAVSDAAFYAPDPTAPFVPSQKGFTRKKDKNRRGESLLSSEGFVIRGSYVDYDNNRIVIPPSGLYYTSRNARNVRALTGETFVFLGRKAYLASFESATVVRRNFDIDYWRLQPTGQMNPIYWQERGPGLQQQNGPFHRAHLPRRPRHGRGQYRQVFRQKPFGAPFHLTQGFSPKERATGTA
jgi:hypothetical protein